MPQAGLHGLAGLPLRNWLGDRQGLMLGVILGSLLPDMDNFAVAAATLAGKSTAGLHRTFTHSLFTAALVTAAFYLAGLAAKRPYWRYLGLGLGMGMLMHILFDLLIWFNGVAILWPLPIWLNFWAKVTPPAWWMTLMDAAEMLFFALFFYSLYRLANRQQSDIPFLKTLRWWIRLEAALFVVFVILAFTLSTGFRTFFGVAYLFSLSLAIAIILRMRATISGPRRRA